MKSEELGPESSSHWFWDNSDYLHSFSPRLEPKLTYPIKLGMVKKMNRVVKLKATGPKGGLGW